MTDLLQKLKTLRIAVVGDVMLDRFIFGDVERISPEAPVPVVQVRTEEERLGGAANVAANCAALGVDTTVFSVVGGGEAALRIQDIFEQKGIHASGLYAEATRVTTVKTRIMAGTQQVVRIDRETKEAVDADVREEFLSTMEDAGPFDAVIVSDYGKGVVDAALMTMLRGWKEKGCHVVVDPKQGNFELYRSTTCITPNEKEAAGASHENIDGDRDAERVGRNLQARLGTDLLLLTRGEHGMSLFKSSESVVHIPTVASHVYDVTGAGDTVIASFTSFLAAGLDPAESARLANFAAGQVVREVGTSILDPAELFSDSNLFEKGSK